MKRSIYSSLLKWKESTNRKPLVLEDVPLYTVSGYIANASLTINL